eukprot:scaffold1769_cov164-Ochromonas_danica.AAC.4
MKSSGTYSWEGRAWIDGNNYHSDLDGRIVLGPSILHQPGKYQEKRHLSIPSVTVISYSVLADYKTHFFFHTAHKAWESRFQTLLAELTSYDADLLCLQDVDHFSDAWAPALMQMGYDSIFKERTHEKELHEEGVVIAMKRERFHLIQTMEVHLNDAVTNNDKGTAFRDRSKTDDVALVTILQPVRTTDLACPICVASVMLSGALADEDVRAAHLTYLFTRIEEMNANFHAPLILGMNLNDRPSSMAYAVCRTGREALSAQVPPKCHQPHAKIYSRTSACISWLPPKLSIADPPISRYKIAWRTGGSTALGFGEEKEVPAGDCIAYHEVIDQHRNRKIVAKEELEYTITRLCAEVPYEFRVCAVNAMGMGPWSESSRPVVLPNPHKATKMPPLQNFGSLQEVLEIREQYEMNQGDHNANISHDVDPLNPRTQLTPRTLTGDTNDQITTARVLPPHSNARMGWKSELNGQLDLRVKTELGRDLITKKSLLRDSNGFKDRKIAMYNDLGITSTYAKINRITDLSHGKDGSTMLLDGKEALYHLGLPNKRQIHHQNLRSVYDSYSVSGEPVLTASAPPARLLHNMDCMDYIFYTEGALVPARILSLPSWSSMRQGETPESSHAVPDYCHLLPFSSSIDFFDLFIQRLTNRMIESEEDLEEGEKEGELLLGDDAVSNKPMVRTRVSTSLSSSSSSSSYSMEDVSRLKQVLQGALKHSYGSSGDQGRGNKPSAGKARRKAVKSPTRRARSPEHGRHHRHDSKSPSRVARRQESMGTGVLGGDYMFFGGRWAPFAMRNPARSNYYLPNGVMGSTHIALGAQLLFDDSFLTTSYSTACR